MAFNICAKRTDSSFGQWLSRYWDYSEETSRICRAIYARFKLNEVQALGYWGAYETIKEENALADPKAKHTKASSKGKGGKGGNGDDKTDKPLTLTLGTHVAKIKKHAEDLLKESEAAPPELFVSPEREGVEFRSLADDLRAALNDLARSILVLYRLASMTNTNAGKTLAAELKRAVDLVKRMETPS